MSKPTDCPVCRKEPAINDSYFGILPGKNCSARQREYSSPNNPIEITTQPIKDSRKEYAKSIVQPFREGELSKEYLQAHGTKGISVTDKQVKNAKNVWPETIKNIEMSRTK